MNIQIHESVKDDKGFTLVELAIVMVIIGLLIGGILKGQEMIANAQVSATVAQAKGIDAATSTFRDMYDALPGDINNPTVRLPNCTGTCANNGDGNARLAGNPGTVATENLWFWAHLNAADLLSGVDNSGNTVWGQGLPSAKAGGGFTVGYTNDGTLPNGSGTGRGGHWLTIQGITGTPGSAALTASEAARMDRKMDDGASDTGSVIASDTGSCESAAGVYNEAADVQDCGLNIRIQG